MLRDAGLQGRETGFLSQAVLDLSVAEAQPTRHPGYMLVAASGGRDI